MAAERTLLPRQLREKISDYLAMGLETKTGLGSRVANDPALIGRILEGREVKPDMESKLLDAMKRPSRKRTKTA